MIVLLTVHGLVHGLVHVMGTVAYLKIGDVAGLPYKTTLLSGSWDIGLIGIGIFGGLWALAPHPGRLHPMAPSSLSGLRGGIPTCSAL